MKAIQLTIPLLFSVLLIASCGEQASSGGNATREQQIPSVQVATMQPQNVTLEEAYPATLQGLEVISIKPRVDGFIQKVYVDEGEVVTKGQALFTIDSPSSQQTLTQAEAAYKTAKLDVERMRALADKEIISSFNLQTYENAYTSAKAGLDQAKAAQSWTTVVSPVNGVVSTINFRFGSLVNNASVLTSVANNSTMVAYFSLNEKELYDFLAYWEGASVSDKIKQIPPVQLVLANGTEYTEMGKIETISGVVNESTGSVNMRASFANPNGFLRSGGSATVILTVPFNNTFVIPQQATFNQQDKVLVFKVQGDSVVQKVVDIEPMSDGKRFVVTNGLGSGDRIVSGNIIGLRNGQKISIQ